MCNYIFIKKLYKWTISSRDCYPDYDQTLQMALCFEGKMLLSACNPLHSGCCSVPALVRFVLIAENSKTDSKGRPVRGRGSKRTPPISRPSVISGLSPRFSVESQPGAGQSRPKGLRLFVYRHKQLVIA